MLKGCEHWQKNFEIVFDKLRLFINIPFETTKIWTAMKFLPFKTSTGTGLALQIANQAIDLALLSADFPHSLDGVIAGGATLTAKIEKAAKADTKNWKAVESFKPAYPIQNPHNVICVGLNYAEHAREGGNAIPEYPAFFLRMRESMLAAEEAIIRPHASHKLDYEAELMIVIGKKARHVKEADALDFVFGYTIFNDGSLRDYQRKGAQWTPGKNFDKTGAVGPVVVTADSLPKGAHGLDIACRLNGMTMQNSNTSDMIFSVAKIIAIVSEFTTLHPGDLIATGTPSGVGYPRNPPVFMKPGDKVEIEIEGVGVLVNSISDEA
jgi:2-keto-4-pentenoate hydratase/2-oxohepta-3-ene-1,7-dioic acid hydratase in catechol pathway